MKNVYKYILVAAIAVALPLQLLAYTKPGDPTGFVNDYSGTLTEEQRQSLETKLSDFEKNTSNEIRSLEGDYIEHYAVKLFEDWKIGKEDKDNGALLLVAIEDRELRIEVGYGLEPYLTDSKSAQIIEYVIKPEFKEGRYFEGIDAGVNGMMTVLNNEELNVPEQSSEGKGFPFQFIFLAAFWLLGLLAGVLGASKSWWAGGLVGVVAGALDLCSLVLAL